MKLTGSTLPWPHGLHNLFNRISMGFDRGDGGGGREGRGLEGQMCFATIY